MHRLIVSAAVLITLVGTAARAEEGTMRVRLGDLNIREEAGAQVALRRIKAASSDFCGEGQVYRSVEGTTNIRKCRKTMTDKAVAQLGAPLVTALYTPATSSPTELARR